jgi:hypothetical protein
MDRRRFLQASLAGALGAPLGAGAQQTFSGSCQAISPDAAGAAGASSSPDGTARHTGPGAPNRQCSEEIGKWTALLSITC